MVTMMKKIATLFDICFITLIVLLVIPTQAQAAKVIPIDQAQIQLVGGGSYVYNGHEQRPEIQSVTLNGEILNASEYDVIYSGGKAVGEYHVTVVGKPPFTGSAEKSYTIRKYPVTKVIPSDCYKVFDGTDRASPRLTINVLNSNDQVTAEYQEAHYSDPYVGENKEVTVSGLSLSGPDADNYELSCREITFENGTGIQPVEATVTYKAELSAGGNELELSSLVKGLKPDNATFNFYDSNQTAGCTLSGSKLISGSATGPVKIEVQMFDLDINGDGKDEYLDGLHYIEVTIVESTVPPAPDSPDQPPKPENPEDPPPVVPPEKKKEQERLELVLTSETVNYGETLLLKTKGGSGEGKVTYSVDYGTGSGAIDKNGFLRATQVGTLWVKAIKEGDADYNETESEAKVITVNQAQISVTVSKRTIRVGDAVPQLTSSDYVIRGLVNGDHMQKNPTLSYASTPNTSRTGSVVIQASGAEVPTGGNYQSEVQYTQGRLTITEQPSYAITLRQPEHGTISSDYSTATEGTVVTLRTTVPAEYELERPTVTYNKREWSLTALGNGRYTFLMPAGAVTVTAVNKPLPQEPEKPPVTLSFTDVHKEDWFYDSVAYVYEKELMTGTGVGLFSPQGTTTRGMIVTILYRMSGSPGVTSYPAFSDVPRDAYYADPVVWANWNEIATGYDHETFGANDPVTRQQLAAILYRYAAYRNYNVTERGDLDQFSDKNAINSYALQPMSWANAVGLINGKGEGILDPCGYATRAEVAAILQRFCENFVVFPTQP